MQSFRTGSSVVTVWRQTPHSLSNRRCREFEPVFFLCVNWFSFLHTKIPRFLYVAQFGFLTLGSPNLYPTHPTTRLASLHIRGTDGHTYLRDAQSGGFRVGQCVNYRSICAAKKVYGHIYGETCRFVITASWLAVGCELASCNVGLRGISSDCVVLRRTSCVVPWYDAANCLGLNTFGTPGHTCFALPEQPPLRTLSPDIYIYISPHVLRPRVSVGRNYVPQKRKGTREKNLSLGPFSLRLVRSAHATGTGVTCGRGTTLGIIIL